MILLPRGVMYWVHCTYMWYNTDFVWHYFTSANHNNIFDFYNKRLQTNYTRRIDKRQRRVVGGTKGCEFYFFLVLVWWETPRGIQYRLLLVFNPNLTNLWLRLHRKTRLQEPPEKKIYVRLARFPGRMSQHCIVFFYTSEYVPKYIITGLYIL